MTLAPKPTRCPHCGGNLMQEHEPGLRKPRVFCLQCGRSPQPVKAMPRVKERSKDENHIIGHGVVR